MAGEGGKLFQKFSSFPRAPILFSKLFNCDAAIPGDLREISPGALCRTFLLRARRAKRRASASVRAVKAAFEGMRLFLCSSFRLDSAGGAGQGRIFLSDPVSAFRTRERKGLRRRRGRDAPAPVPGGESGQGCFQSWNSLPSAGILSLTPLWRRQAQSVA